MAVDRPCTIGDGILSIDDPSLYLSQYSEAVAAGRVMRFVPSSGAASRMFDVFRNAATDPRSVGDWISDVERFAFFPEWVSAARNSGYSFDDHWRRGMFAPLIDVLLSQSGLNFDSLPKALIPFHRYPDHSRTAFDEHVAETQMLLGRIPSVLHFTVSHRHHAAFQTASRAARQKYSHITIEFSFQHPSTDTISLDAGGRVLRDGDGRIVFRPGGHGALLKNLQECNGDMVVIKNIDNVMHEHRLAPLIGHRQMLIGVLVDAQDKIFGLLRSADHGVIEEKNLRSVLNHLSIPFPSGFDAWTLSDRTTWLHETLNRPIRVCAMVPSAGHPGGGPFWVPSKGGITRQIVELEQLNPSAVQDNRVTHFNPVDMACGLKDYHGQSFDLMKFRDEQQYLVVQKTYLGQPIRILEWPGLWNGSMAGWLTLFVEVPRETFTPVKTIIDLLKPEHQA